MPGESHSTKRNSSDEGLPSKRLRVASRSGDLSQESSFVLSPSRSLSIASQLSYERQRFKSQMEAEHLEWEERIRKAESRAEQSIAAVHKLKSENQQLEMEIEKLQENQNKTELAHLKEKQELKGEVHRVTKKYRAFELEVAEAHAEYEKTIQAMELELNTLRAQHVVHVRELAAADKELERLQNESRNASQGPIDLERDQLEIEELRRKLEVAQDQIQILKEESMRDLNFQTSLTGSAYDMEQSVVRKGERSAASFVQAQVAAKQEDLQRKLDAAELALKAHQDELERTRLRMDDLLAAEAQRDAMVAEQNSYQDSFQEVLSEYRSLQVSSQARPGKSPLRTDSFAPENSDGTLMDMVRLLRKLQTDLVFEVREHRSDLTKIKSLESKITDMQNVITKLELQSSTLERTNDELEAKVVKLSQSKALFVKQQHSMMDIIRKISAQSNSEQFNSTISDGNKNETNTFSSAQKEQLDQLIASVNQTLESIVSSTQNEALATSANHPKVQEMEERIKLLSKQLEASESDASRLQNQVYAGAFNPKTTKVVHLRTNPEKWERAEVMEALRDENIALKLEIEQLQQQDDPHHNMQTPGAGLSRAMTFASTAKKTDRDVSAKISGVDPQKSYERLKVLFREKLKRFEKLCTY